MKCVFRIPTWDKSNYEKIHPNQGKTVVSMSQIIINTHLNTALHNLCFSAGVKCRAKCKQYCCLHAWENDRTIEKALSKSGEKT